MPINSGTGHIMNFGECVVRFRIRILGILIVVCGAMFGGVTYFSGEKPVITVTRKKMRKPAVPLPARKENGKEKDTGKDTATKPSIPEKTAPEKVIAPEPPPAESAKTAVAVEPEPPRKKETRKAPAPVRSPERGAGTASPLLAENSGESLLLTATVVLKAGTSKAVMRKVLSILVKDLGARHLKGGNGFKHSTCMVYAYRTRSASREDRFRKQWCGRAVLVAGEEEARVEVRKKPPAPRQSRPVKAPLPSKKEPVAAGPDAVSILPHEKRVYAALKKRLGEVLVPPRRYFETRQEWISAMVAAESACLHKVAQEFGMSVKTVKSICHKVEILDR